MRGERRGADERRARRAGRRRDSHSLYTHVRRGSRTHTCLVSSEFVTPLRSRGTGGLGISISFFIVFDFILCVGHLRERRDLESDTSRCSDLAWVSHRISQGPRSACSAQQPSRERPAAARTAMFSLRSGSVGARLGARGRVGRVGRVWAWPPTGRSTGILRGPRAVSQPTRPRATTNHMRHMRGSQPMGAAPAVGASRAAHMRR